jgi:hypothetical protein
VGISVLIFWNDLESSLNNVLCFVNVTSWKYPNVIWLLMAISQCHLTSDANFKVRHLCLQSSQALSGHLHLHTPILWSQTSNENTSWLDIVLLSKLRLYYQIETEYTRKIRRGHCPPIFYSFQYNRDNTHSLSITNFPTLWWIFSIAHYF